MAPAPAQAPRSVDTSLCAGPCIDVVALAARVTPAVVNITTTEEQRVPELSRGERELFELFFGPLGHDGRTVRRTGLGSGFIIDPSGYVVTNEHVVRDTVDVRVRFADEHEMEANVVGRDSNLDIALLKIDGAKNLPVLAFGSSEAVRVGEPVVALGNPYGLGHTVTLGIVSAKGRALGTGPYDDFIQTDASINPGNSGGPLLNSRGEVIGINTVIREGAAGIGFAIPSDDMKDILPTLRDKGMVARGKLGVRVQAVTEPMAEALHLDKPRGALIADLDPNGGGAHAGLTSGDVILAVNGKPIVHAGELARNVSRNPPGSSVSVSISRRGRPMELRATLDKIEEEHPAPPPKPAPVPKSGALIVEALGLEVSDAPGGGVRVEDTLPGRDTGDVEPGDVIVDVDGVEVHDAAALRQLAQSRKHGTAALLKLKRDDVSRFSAVRVR
jgi:serine protease Do